MLGHLALGRFPWLAFLRLALILRLLVFFDMGTEASSPVVAPGQDRPRR